MFISEQAGHHKTAIIVLIIKLLLPLIHKVLHE